jgi:hypothetical protein
MAIPSRSRTNIGNLGGTTGSTYSGASNTGNSGTGSGGNDNWDKIAKAVAGLMPVIGPLLSGLFGGSKSQDSNPLMTPEMRQLLQVQVARTRAADPLYGDVMRMVRGMLPTRYRGETIKPPIEPGVTPGTDLRKPTGRGVPTGRYAIPRIPEY